MVVVVRQNLVAVSKWDLVVVSKLDLVVTTRDALHLHGVVTCDALLLLSVCLLPDACPLHSTGIAHARLHLGVAPETCGHPFHRLRIRAGASVTEIRALRGPMLGQAIMGGVLQCPCASLAMCLTQPLLRLARRLLLPPSPPSGSARQPPFASWVSSP